MGGASSRDSDEEEFYIPNVDGWSSSDLERNLSERIEEYVNGLKDDSESPESRNYREKYFLDVNEKINKRNENWNRFFDRGLIYDYEEYSQCRKKPPSDKGGEIIVSYPEEDEILCQFIEEVVSKVKPVNICLEERYYIHTDKVNNRIELNNDIVGKAEVLANRVFDWFGGNKPGLIQRYEKLVNRIQMEKPISNVIPLGSLKGCGLCRHRAILFKLLCDEIGIPCRIIRGYIDNGQSRDARDSGHAWNEILVSVRPEKKGLNRQYLVEMVVDCMNGFWWASPWASQESSDEEEEEEEKSKFEPKSSVKRLSMLRFIKRKDDPIFNRVKYVNLGHPNEEGDLELVEKIYKKYRESKEDLLDMSKLEIGGGRFGTVYAVKNPEVVKRFKPNKKKLYGKKLTDEETKRLALKSIKFKKMEERYIRKEVGLHMLLYGPNISKVYGCFKDPSNKGIVVVMDRYDCDADEFFMELKSFKYGHLTAEKRMVEALILLLECTKGLEHVHSFDILHFDFKLNNILINWDRKTHSLGVVKISDFGRSMFKSHHVYVSSSAASSMSSLHDLGTRPPEVLGFYDTFGRYGNENLEEKERKVLKHREVFKPSVDVFHFGSVLSKLQHLFPESYPFLRRTYIDLWKRCKAEKPEERPKMYVIQKTLEWMLEELHKKLKQRKKELEESNRNFNEAVKIIKYGYDYQEARRLLDSSYTTREKYLPKEEVERVTEVLYYRGIVRERLGVIENDQNELLLARVDLADCLRLLPTDSLFYKANCNECLGLIYMRLGKYRLASQVFNDCLKDRTKMEGSFGWNVGLTYANFASLYFVASKRGKYKKEMRESYLISSRGYFLHAIRILSLHLSTKENQPLNGGKTEEEEGKSDKKLKDRLLQQADLFHNYAEFLEYRGSLRMSLKFYEKSLEVRKGLVVHHDLFHTLYNKGIVHEKLEEYEKALDSFKMCLEIMEVIHHEHCRRYRKRHPKIVLLSEICAELCELNLQKFEDAVSFYRRGGLESLAKQLEERIRRKNLK